jgi:phosphoglycerate dehydrogenase-like enzyme
MTVVAVLEDIHSAFLEVPSFQRLRERAEVRVHQQRLEPPARAAALRDVDVVVGLRERTRFDGAFVADAPNLKLIVQTGRVGPNIDLDAVTRAGVLVASAAGGSSRSTVELTFGLMIGLLRQIPQSDRRLRAGAWEVPYGRVLRGRTLGIVGLGRIGTQVAEIAVRAFGMQLLAWSRNMTPERAAQAGGNAADLDELLRTADVVSVHLALNEGTRGLLTAEKLALMRPDAYFINTARGRILDEPALIRMLDAGRLAGAGLDVFWEEPLPPDSPLLRLDNVVLTPHVGWPADESYRDYAEGTVRVIESYLDGDVINLANPEARAAVRSTLSPGGRG